MVDAADFPELLAPAPRPCKSCPYRRDVPAQIWHADEYAKLPAYDQPTGEQPTGVFRCHQDTTGRGGRICAGWAHVHGHHNPPGHELLALRLARLAGLLTDADVYAVDTYRTDVACFTSGTDAARHGTDGPFTADSAAMAAAIVRRRPENVRRRPENVRRRRR